MDIDGLLRTIRQAALLQRGTPGRRGMVVHLPADAEDVLVAGDLHGNLRNFKRILDLADLDSHPNRHLVLQEFVHGSGRYPNAGCTSHRLLDVVCALKLQHPNRVHLLLGNHELSQWTGRKIAKEGTYLNDLFDLGVEAAHGARARDVLDAYGELFASLDLAVKTPGGTFVCHSIPEGRHLSEFDAGVFDRFGMERDNLGPKSAVYRLVWGKDISEETAERFCRVVDASFLVTGHIAQKAGYAVVNRRQVIVDCAGSPAACVLIPAAVAVGVEDMNSCVRLIHSA